MRAGLCLLKGITDSHYTMPLFFPSGTAFLHISTAPVSTHTLLQKIPRNRSLPCNINSCKISGFRTSFLKRKKKIKTIKSGASTIPWDLQGGLVFLINIPP